MRSLESFNARSQWGSGMLKGHRKMTGRRVRDASFGLLVILLLLAGGVRAEAASGCLIYTDYANCYPDQSSEFEWDNYVECSNFCNAFYVGGFSHVVQFVWDNPCESQCYCETCTPAG